jgi:serine/threonine-protein kinase
MNDRPAAFDRPDLGDRYEIEELVGEGSTGRVYRARDRQLDRTVAIKVLRSSDASEVGRLQNAARAQARVDHENVCRIFDVNRVQRRSFIAMKFIEGNTLRREAPRLETEEKAALMEQVARAVQAAHARGLVHRGLRPGNIMVERRPGGRLHAVVLDFGLDPDRVAGDDGCATRSAGDTAYAAPEQLQGSRPDHRADVYGLGATLYGLIAEQAPFFGTSDSEVTSRVLSEEPLPLGLVVPGSPEDLETIVAVAMAKDPAQRYPTAGALADDLGRWLAGEPIRARVAGPLYRVQTRLRTHRFLSAFLAAVLVFGAAAVGITLWQQLRAEQRRQLVDRFNTEIEQIDRLLRRARMMPMHDTSGAELEVRRRLAAVESSLVEHGALARGPAHYALGFGHLMLRDFEQAEGWLQAAMDAGYSDPEVESALGIAQAMQILENGAANTVDPRRLDDAIRHLSAGGPRTVERDQFHRALALFLEGRYDEARRAARESADRFPWLYEALQLEGDILLARSAEREARGDVEGALSDLAEAGIAYASGLDTARSDSWLYAAEADRLVRLVELRLRARLADETSPEITGLRQQVQRLRAESRGALGG